MAQYDHKGRLARDDALVILHAGIHDVAACKPGPDLADIAQFRGRPPRCPGVRGLPGLLGENLLQGSVLTQLRRGPARCSPGS